MSIAGGYYKAVEAAAELHLETVQIFTKNNNQWQGKPITPDEEQRFADALRQRHIVRPIAHASYLINLASPDETLWRKSADAFVVELERAGQLGVGYVVVHPGAHTTSSPEEGIAAVARALNDIHPRLSPRAARCLLENTAGQGSCLGRRFEELAGILSQVQRADLVGVCFDTCHAFAAGYDLRTPAGYREAMQEFDQLIGLERIAAFHLNDSKKGLGSRVDRHEHIGHGELGIEAFASLLNDERFANVPMYLETPKEDCEGEPWDAVNLRTLRGLVRG
jgi:deoxyribonuclease-4